MLFVCLFDLISSGSRKNDNLWKSLEDIVVNGAPLNVGSEFDFEQWKGSKMGHVRPQTKNAKIAITHSKGQSPKRYFLGT